MGPNGAPGPGLRLPRPAGHRVQTRQGVIAKAPEDKDEPQALGNLNPGAQRQARPVPGTQLARCGAGKAAPEGRDPASTRATVWEAEAGWRAGKSRGLTRLRGGAAQELGTDPRPEAKPEEDPAADPQPQPPR